jgi:hypothetical protein
VIAASTLVTLFGSIMIAPSCTKKIVSSSSAT